MQYHPTAQLNKDTTEMNKNSLANLKPYKKGQTGNKNGRPKKYVLTLQKEGYKLSEINDTIQALMTMSVEELRDIWENEKSNVLEKMVAGAIRKSLEKGNLESMETLLNRVYGKPKEKIEQDVKITNNIIKLKFGNGETESDK